MEGAWRVHGWMDGWTHTHTSQGHSLYGPVRSPIPSPIGIWSSMVPFMVPYSPMVLYGPTVQLTEPLKF